MSKWGAPRTTIRYRRLRVSIQAKINQKSHDKPMEAMDAWNEDLLFLEEINPTEIFYK